MEKDITKIYEEIIKDIPYLSLISPAYIQRKYEVDYKLASSLIDILEEKGFLGQRDGAKPRGIIKNNL